MFKHFPKHHLALQRHLQRHLHRTIPRPKLFSKNNATPSLFQSPSTDPMSLFKPSQKAQPPVNPADILTQNDILLYASKPHNYIESIKDNGFHLSNSYLITSPDAHGHVIGLCLIGSETFEVDVSGMYHVTGHVVEFDSRVLEIFAKVHPKPEIVVVGLGRESRMLSSRNRDWFSEVGISLEVSDSTNSGQIFDLLSTERPGVIGALLLPPNV